jgi:multiple sugar transport system permease protein
MRIGKGFRRAATSWRHLNRLGDVSTALIAILPALLVFVIFNIYPTLYSAVLSFMDWDGLSVDREFVGLQNYKDLFTSSAFWNSLWATIYYTLGVILVSVPLALLISVALNSGIRGQPFYRTLYFIPVITSTVAAAMVWKLMLNPGSGLLNVALRGMGIIDAPSWLRSTTWAMPAVILVGVWKRLGFNMVIYLAALQNIPRVYYEAAEVDGASNWARLLHITIPLLSPTTALLVVMGLIDSFLLFDQVYVMTNGGPSGTTDVLGFMLYRNAFSYFDLGTASAIAMVILVIVGALTLLQWRMSNFGAEQA